MEEKDDKLKKAEKDSRNKQINAPSGGKAKGSSYRNKVDFVRFYCILLFHIIFITMFV